MKLPLFTGFVLSLMFASAALAQPVKPYPVTTGAVQSLLMRGGLAASVGSTTARTKVTRAICTPAGPVVGGIGYVKVRCLIWTPTGQSTIVVSTFTRAAPAWFFRWRFA